MDFNAIYQSIAPYFGTGAMATAIITIITLAFKVLSLCKDARTTFSNTHAESIEAFKKAIPSSLYLSLESLTKSELSKIITQIKDAIDERFLSQIKSNTEITQAIAQALISMKAIPDSAKLKISELLELPEVDTTEGLKIDLIPVEENGVVHYNKQILID